MGLLDIIKLGLEVKGFDGLCYPDGENSCGCSKDDLAPCGEPMTECEAAILIEDLFYPLNSKYAKEVRATRALNAQPKPDEPAS